MTLTTTALETAASEMSLERRGVKEVVLVVTDGKPTKRDATTPAAREVRRRMAKLLFGAVTLNKSILQDMRKWASSPSEATIFNIKSYKMLDAG